MNLPNPPAPGAGLAAFRAWQTECARITNESFAEEIKALKENYGKVTEEGAALANEVHKLLVEKGEEFVTAFLSTMTGEQKASRALNRKGHMIGSTKYVVILKSIPAGENAPDEDGE